MKKISVTFLVGALLLTGCDFNKKKVESQPEQRMEDETTVVPEPAQEELIIEETTAMVSAPIPAREMEQVAAAEPVPVEYYTPDDTSEYPNYGVEQAMEEEWLNEEQQRQAMQDERWREYEAKTYNEQQISDDVDDYPILFETNELTFAERQFSY